MWILSFENHEINLRESWLNTTDLGLLVPDIILSPLKCRETRQVDECPTLDSELKSAPSVAEAPRSQSLLHHLYPLTDMEHVLVD